MKHGEEPYSKESNGDFQEEDISKGGKSRLDMLEFQTKLLSSVDVAIVAIDLNDNIVYWNGLAEEITGRSAADMVGRSAETYFNSCIMGLPFKELRTMLADNNTITQNVRFIFNESTFKYIDISLKYAYDRKTGTVDGIVISLRDVTEGTEYRENLQRKEAEYLELIDSASEGLFIFDQEEFEVHLSEHWKKLLGFEHLRPQEVTSAAINNIYPEDMALAQSIFLDAFARKITRINAELRIKTASSEYKWLMVQCKILYTKNGMLAKCFGTVRDIHDRKYRELHLEFLEEIGADIFRLETNESLLNIVGDKIKRYFGAHRLTVSYYDDALDTGKYIYDNPGPGEEPLSRIWNITEYHDHELLDSVKTGRVIAVDEIAQHPIYGPFAENFERNRIRSMIVAPLKQDGKLSCLITLKHDQPRHWLVGEIELFQELAMRIFLAMERARSYEALQASEEKYRTLFNSIDECFCIIDMIFDAQGNPVDWRYLETNTTFNKQTVLVDPVGKLASEINADFNDNWLEIFGRVALTGKPVRFTKEAKAYHRWFDIYAFKNDEAPGSTKISILYRDITTGMQNNRKLAFQAKTLANVRDAVIVVDENNVITYWNKAFEELFGFKDKAEGTLNQTNIARIGNFINETLKDKRYSDESSIAIREITYILSSGKRLVIDVNSSILTDPKGEYKGMVISCRDVSHRIAAYNELERSEKTAQKLVDELRKADEVKTQFLSMLSHELRNPLTSIMLSLGILERVIPNGEQDRLARDIIKRQSIQLSCLVDNLLDVSRITHNMIELKKEKLELNELVRKAAQDYEIYFSNANLELAVELFNGTIYMEADRARLIQVIGNLLHNAAKFSTPGGKTTVTVARDEISGEAVIRVKDNGLGVPQEILPKIFEPFTQADSSIDRKRGGLGLGLAIVKGNIELHQGSVTAYTEGLGKGMEIIIRLPVSLVIENPEEKRMPIYERRDRSFRILVIDDIKDIAEIIRTLLEQFDHQVETAYDGIEGLEKAKSFKPDIIICDIGLPGINGYDLSRIIRKDKVIGQEVFMIALTGYAQAEDIKLAKEAGFDLHLAKPIDLGNLEQIIAIYSASEDGQPRDFKTI